MPRFARPNYVLPSVYLFLNKRFWYAQDSPALVVLTERKTHHYSCGKGVITMTNIPRQSVPYRFDAFCKKVLRNEAVNYLLQIYRQYKREVSFSDLSYSELGKLCVTDDYPSDCFTFTAHSSALCFDAHQMLLEHDRHMHDLIKVGPVQVQINLPDIVSTSG